MTIMKNDDDQGKVHNPSGAGVRAVSAQVKNKANKMKQQSTGGSMSSASGSVGSPNNGSGGGVMVKEVYETVVKEEGSSRRNITRKKSGTNEGTYDNRNKKQGGHGKGKWNELKDGSMDDYDVPLDKNDPLYDETQEERYILSSGGGAVANVEASPTADSLLYNEEGKAVYGPMLTLPEFKIRLAESIREYFDSADSDEVIRSIEELKCRAYHREVVKKAISLSLDEGPRERELISRLLTCLHPTPLDESDMEEGFDLLLNSLEDLTIDCPDAKAMVGSFLARAVVDEVVPPAFLSNQNNERAGDPVIERAVSLLSREHCTARLERVWGPGDGRPVAELKEVLDQLLKEYLLSRELDEGARCVRELNASHFHHELVKRGVTHAMEESNPKESLDAMVALFSFLVKNAIVSEYQVAKGLSRLKKILPDLKLDIPSAPELLDEFETMARDCDCLPSTKNNNGASHAEETES